MVADMLSAILIYDNVQQTNIYVQTIKQAMYLFSKKIYHIQRKNITVFQPKIYIFNQK